MDAPEVDIVFIPRERQAQASVSHFGLSLFHMGVKKVDIIGGF
jgi:hypothetical protein